MYLEKPKMTYNLEQRVVFMLIRLEILGLTSFVSNMLVLVVYSCNVKSLVNLSPGCSLL
jgi:hypothetical protein